MQSSKLQFKVQNYKSELKIKNFKLQLFTFNFEFLTDMGQSLVELIIAIGIAAAVMPALFFGFITSTQAKPQEIQNLAAAALVKEGLEAARSASQGSWSNIATNGTYHPVVVSGNWSLVTGSETISQYTRAIVISDVQRDSSGNIVSSGGTVDPSSKKVTATVSWSTPFASSVSSSVYLTRYLNNVSFNQPSPSPGAAFSTYTSGGSSSVNVTTSNVTLNSLSGGGKADWCVYNPAILSRFNMTGSSPANALWAVAGATYAGTGNSASGVDVQALTVSQPAYPTAPTITSSWADGNNNFKTNDIYADSSFSYIATNASKQEVVVFDNTLATNPRAVRTSYNLGTNINASGVYELNDSLGSIIYAVSSDSKLYTMDRSLTGSQKATLGNLTLGGVGNRVKALDINGTAYVFIAMSTTTNQLKIVPMLTKSTFGTPINLDLGNGLAGKDLDISADGSRVYITTAYAAGKQNVFVVDISTITSPTIIGSTNTNGMSPVSISMVQSKNRLLVVGSGGTYQYQVFDLRQETAPAQCGGLTSTASDPFTIIYDVASFYDSTNDRAFGYIVTNDNNNEFKIIEGGAGNQFASSGTYESTTFDAGSTVSFNRLQTIFNQPAGTNITFQVAVSAAVGGSCSGVSFVYQNPINIVTSTSGTTTTYNGTIPYTSNQGRCFRYKATLTPSADFKSAPTLQSATINYTP